jgi:hypothetical protein
MHPVTAHQVGKYVVDDRVRKAGQTRMARQARMVRQARAARMSGRGAQVGEEPSGKAGNFLADAGEWVKARIASASA